MEAITTYLLASLAFALFFAMGFTAQYYGGAWLKNRRRKRKYARLDKKMDKAIDYLDKMTPEERERWFPRDTRPEGWISIEDSLPMMLAIDVGRWYTEYRVKYADGHEDITRVGDHNTWYYYAKEAGITHWWHDKPEEI